MQDNAFFPHGKSVTSQVLCSSRATISVDIASLKRGSCIASLKFLGSFSEDVAARNTLCFSENTASETYAEMGYEDVPWTVAEDLVGVAGEAGVVLCLSRHWELYATYSLSLVDGCETRCPLPQLFHLNTLCH